MKKNTLFYWILCVSVASLIVSACSKKKIQTEITSRIEYSVNIQSPEADMEWWIQNIDGTKRDYLTNQLMGMAADPQIQLEDINYKPLRNNILQSLYFLNDSAHYLNNGLAVDTLIKGEITSKNIKRLRFREQWLLDANAFEIEKKVLAVCPVAVFYNNEGKEIYSKPLYWININFKNTSPDLRNITERIQYDVPIHNLNNKKDWWIENIEPQFRDKFLNTLMEAAYSDKYRLYDNFKTKLTAAELKNSLNFSDTIRLTQANPPYNEFDTVIVHKFDPKDIHSIRFIEEWKLSPISLEITKRIIGICPVVNSYDSNNEFRGIKPLFWIYFNEKYPECITEIDAGIRK